MGKPDSLDKAKEKASGVKKMPTQEETDRIVKSMMAHQAKEDKVKGDKKAAMERECEKVNHHKKALKDSLKIAKMAPHEASEYLAYMDLYREQMKLDHPDLGLDGGGDERPELDEDEDEQQRAEAAAKGDKPSLEVVH